jgi:hypothetical protein
VVSLWGGYATGELERFSASVSGVLPDLPLARDHAHQIHSPALGLAPSTLAEEANDASPRAERQNLPKLPAARSFFSRDADDEVDQIQAPSRITLRAHDPSTGEEIERGQVVKGYEHQRGQFVTFMTEELKALDVEARRSSTWRGLYHAVNSIPSISIAHTTSDGPIAAETLRVIGAAMAEVGVVGLGRLTLSRRERMVMVEPRGTGMALFTLRAADEVRAPQFGSAEGELDAEMVAIARAIIAQRTANSIRTHIETATIASTGIWWSKAEGGACRPASRCRYSATQEGLNAAID